jgi:O-antigen/teichoic acid export membrane protein
MDHLKSKAIQAGLWVGTTSFFSKIVSFTTTLLLAKLLTPDDIGLIAIASLVIASIGLFREMGLSRALIYERKDVEKAADTAFFIIPAVSLGLYLLAFVSAPFIASFFKDHHITLIVRLLAISLIISSFGEVPSALFEKEIDFKKRAFPEALYLITYGIVSVWFAFLGFSYWSMVIGQLAAAVANLISTWWISDWRPQLSFSKSAAKRLLGYGKYIAGMGVVHFAIRNIDDAFVGRMLDKATLGAYYLAYRIANLPATNITNIIGRVMFPVYTRIADYTYDLRNAFLKTLKFTALITVPLTFGIIALSRDFLILLYQDKWIAAVVPIQILSLFGLIRSLGSGMGGVFMAVGKPDIMLKISTGQLIILASLLYPTVKLYGIVGVCVLCVIGILFSAIANYIKLKGILRNSNREILNILVPIFLFSSVATVIPKLIANALWERGNIFSLTVQVCLIVLLYSAQVLCFDKGLRNSLRGKLRLSALLILKEKLLQ